MASSPHLFQLFATKRDHQTYLANGGLGFLLGDRLNYGRENIEEAYYNMHTCRGLYFELGLSHVDHPGYNPDHGRALGTSRPRSRRLLTPRIVGYLYNFLFSQAKTTRAAARVVLA